MIAAAHIIDNGSGSDPGYIALIDLNDFVETCNPRWRNNGKEYFVSWEDWHDDDSDECKIKFLEPPQKIDTVVIIYLDD
jgi:hypothetical protein